MTGHGDPARLQAVTVAGDYFTTFGVQPILGRTLRPDESAAGNDKVVMLSEARWRGTFGGDPGVLGQKLLLNGEGYEVVGVMPRSFTSMLDRGTDLWVPLVFTPGQINGSVGNEFLGFTGRMKPGVTMGVAQREMTALAGRMRADRPGTRPDDWTLSVKPLRESVADPRHAEGDARPSRRRGACSPDRLRQRGQPAAGPGCGPLPRDCGARGPGRLAWGTLFASS